MPSSKVSAVVADPGSVINRQAQSPRQAPSQFQEFLQEYIPGSKGFLNMWIDGFPQRIRRVKHEKLRVACGSCLQISFFVIFTFLVYSTYKSNANAAFLSLSQEAGTCSTVPITTTQGVQLDSFGMWETNSQFVKQEALYHVQFSEYDGDDGSWKLDMAELNAVISAELEFLKSSDDFALKILHLTSWRKTINAMKGGTMTIWFNADPAAIFDLQDHQLTVNIGEPADGCPPIDVWHYSNGKYTLIINDIWDGSLDGPGGLPISAANPGNFTYNCASFDFQQLGFNWDYPTKDFEIEIDLRSLVTVAAVNLGIISTSDLLAVADALYLFFDDEEYSIIPMYDPKYRSMIPVYVENTGSPTDAIFQRVGNSGLVPELKGLFYSETVAMGTLANPYFMCPALCEASSGAGACSTPAFQIQFRAPTTGYTADFNAATGIPTMAFGMDAYTNEMYILNDAQLDPGRIACKTTQVGSKGKLGNLEPISSSDFLAALESSKPFKLAESYFFCYPNKVMTFVESFGIAQGNASMLFSFLLMCVILSLSATKMLHVTVTQSYLDDTMMLLAEVIKIGHIGGELRDEHKEVIAALNKVVAAAAVQQRQPAHPTNTQIDHMRVEEFFDAHESL